MRIYKKEVAKGSTTASVKEEWYLRVNGQELAIYNIGSGKLTWFVHGANRIAKIDHQLAGDEPAITGVSLTYDDAVIFDEPNEPHSEGGDDVPTIDREGDIHNSYDPFYQALKVTNNTSIPKVIFYIYDHLGNTRITYSTNMECEGEVDINYTLEAVIDYYPYGKVLREYANGASERYLTTQHERDTETGLDYRGARFYDSDIARFLSLDPLAMDFPEWSDYNYVIGNPVMFIDPDGKAPTAFTPETVWDVINVVMGATSFTANVASGNVVGALIDGIGLLYDGAAAATPVVPAGASTLIGTYRLANMAENTISALNKASNLVQGSNNYHSKIKRAVNSIKENGKISDVLGAVQEKLGITLSITKKTGKKFNHVKEITQTINSLKNAASDIGKKIIHELKNGELTDEAMDVLKNAKKEAESLAKKYSDILKEADKVAKLGD